MSDFSGLLKVEFRQKLEKQLADFEKETTDQIIVAIFPSLEGEKMEDFTLRLMNQWGVGKKGKNNGVGVILFIQDRKIRLEVGKGLTTLLTDTKAQSILDRQMTPFFKKGDFQKGISSGLQAIFRVLRQN